MVIIDVSGAMKHVDAKYFAMLLAWWRIEEDFNIAVNKISETFSSMSLGV